MVIREVQRPLRNGPAVPSPLFPRRHYLGNESRWCKPSDGVLGKSVVKSDRTARRITVERNGILIKHKRLGTSQYEFPELEDKTGHLLAELDAAARERPDSFDTKIGQFQTQDRPPVGRTEPSYLEPSYCEPPYYTAPSKDGAYLVDIKRVEEALQATPLQPQHYLEGPTLNEAAKQLRRDLFIQEHCPVDKLMAAAAAEVEAPGTGAAMARAAASENWKAKRSA
jgi:hypothetical protein